MKERSIDMKFILDEPVVSDEEYAKLIKMDWNTRATGDTTLYVCASSHASEEELISTGLRDYKRHFKSGFDFRDMRKPGFTVLEYGCGIGRMSNHIARDVYTLHAVDICEEHIKIAKQRLSSIHNIEFEAVNGLDLHNFRDGKFDHIFSYMVFQHIGSESVIKNILIEMDRVLKHGGTMTLQFRGVGNFEQNCSGNTWHGIATTVEFIYEFADEVGIDVVEHTGSGTDWFWVTFKKV